MCVGEINLEDSREREKNEISRSKKTIEFDCVSFDKYIWIMWLWINFGFGTFLFRKHKRIVCCKKDDAMTLNKSSLKTITFSLTH